MPDTGSLALGYRKLTVDQLTSLRIHGASLDFVREMQSLGFSGLAPVQLAVVQ